MEALVVYYSQTGNTEEVARSINEELMERNIDREVISIEPVVEKDYDTNVEEAKKGAQVDIEEVRSDLEGDDILCLGTPVWCGAPATPVNTYLSRLEGLVGTKILCFVTHGGGGAGNTFDIMSKRLKEKGGETKGTLSLYSREVSSKVRDKKVSQAIEHFLGQK